MRSHKDRLKKKLDFGHRNVDDYINAMINFNPYKLADNRNPKTLGASEEILILDQQQARNLEEREGRSLGSPEYKGEC